MQKFPAKIDQWYKVLMYSTVLMFVPMFFFVPQEEWIVLIVTMVFTSILILPILWNSYYVLTNEFLIMRLGYIKLKISYKNIKSIETKDGWNTKSGMALSRERVKIIEHHKSIIRGTTYISPENREMFILELTNKCTNLDERNINFD